MSWPRLTAMAVVAGVVWTAHPEAIAGVADTLGVGPAAMGRAGALAAAPGSYECVFDNPAGLTFDWSAQPGGYDVALGFVYAHPAVRVEALGAREPDVAPASDAAQLLVGARFDLERMAGIPGLALGVAFLVPRSLFRWHIRPDDELQWLWWTDRLDRLGVHLAAAWRPLRWLSVGAGIEALVDAETLTEGFVDSPPRRARRAGEPIVVSARLGERVAIYGKLAPVVGVVVEPVAGFRLAAVWRAALYVDDWGWTRIDRAPVLGSVGYVHRFAHYYRPQSVSLGASVQPWRSLRLVAGVAWQQWSRLLTSNHQTLGAGRAGDVLVPGAAAEWTARRGVTVRAGYRYRPAPVDNAGGPTNLLASSHHVFGAGARLGLRALGWKTHPDLAVGISVQLVRMVPRTERKDGRRFASDEALWTNPGYPGYRFWGWVVATSFDLEARW